MATGLERHVGRNDPDPADVAELFQRSLTGIRTHRNLHPGVRFDPLAQPRAPLDSVPEGLRGHTEDEIVRLAGHHLIDGGEHCASNVGQ
jgi:hypothetical protein